VMTVLMAVARIMMTAVMVLWVGIMTLNFR